MKQRARSDEVLTGTKPKRSRLIEARKKGDWNFGFIDLLRRGDLTIISSNLDRRFDSSYTHGEESPGITIEQVSHLCLYPDILPLFTPKDARRTVPFS